MAETTIPNLKELFAPVKAMLPERADVYISVYPMRRMPLTLSVYPEGIIKRRRVEVEGDTWEGLFAAIQERWAEAFGEHERQLIRKMALDIIRITAEMGACSDAALRAGEFSHEEVARYGERACADANEIAGKGPFTITPISAISNAA